MITVFNKMDCVEEIQFYPKVTGNKIYISAKEDESLRVLTEQILERVYASFREMHLLIPYEEGKVVSYFMENAQVLSMEYEKEGTKLHVRCHPGDKEKYSCYEERKAE